MTSRIKQIINNSKSKYVFSFILGIGLASIFRKVCANNKCIIHYAAPISEIKNKIFRNNGKCYKFIEEPTNCNGSAKIYESAS